VTVVVAAVLIAVLTIVLVVVRNGLVRKRNRVQEAFAAVDVQLVRRHAVIPRWATAVGGAFAQERVVLARAARAAEQARGGVVPLIGVAEGELTAAVLELQRFVEDHPQLGTGTHALRLHEDLLSTENRVAFARQHYNDSAMLFNTAVQTVPRNLVAALFRIRPASYLELQLLGEQP